MGTAPYHRIIIRPPAQNTRKLVPGPPLLVFPSSTRCSACRSPAPAAFWSRLSRLRGICRGCSSCPYTRNRAILAKTLSYRITPPPPHFASVWGGGMEKGKKILEPRNAPVLRSSAGRSRGWGRQGGSCGQICGPEWAIGLCPLTTPRPARAHEQDEPAHHHRKPLLPSQRATKLPWVECSSSSSPVASLSFPSCSSHQAPQCALYLE